MQSIDVKLPTVSPWLLWGFQRYVDRYLRKHFNAVRLVKGTRPQLADDEAVICFANHPGWWDPLIACFLNQRLLDNRLAFSPIDQRALDSYPLFRRLGYFGIDVDTLAGAKHFLATSRAILACPGTAIWITPGGRFSDVREATRFQPGLGHLVASLDRVTLLPLALEYLFWEERTPEVLLQFGSPIRGSGKKVEKEVWQTRLQTCLAETQADLARLAIQRDPRQFELLLEGAAGVGGLYDWLRGAGARLRGRRFDRRHARLGAADA